MKLTIILPVVFLLLSAAVWFLIGPMAISVFGEHRERESAIESWAKSEVVSTRLGEIVGLQRDMASGRVLAFLGIRYAEPPVGERRFKPAVSAGAWEGIYDATRFPNSPIQIEADALTREPNSDIKSEDCLFLSVYTPSTQGENRPVLFWIHGGAFQYGSGNGYSGAVLATQGDVVVVSVNYRLGMLGFLDLSKYGDEFAGSASNGIRDQITALNWVRQNIADYGGDPNNVTIFGESAGASSVQSIIAAPSADGLYHKAIVHSGMSIALPPYDAATDIVKRLELDDPMTLPSMLTKMTSSEIVALQKSGIFASGGIVDGTVVTRSLQQAIKERGRDGVPIIVGSNEDEGSLFTYITPRYFYKLTSLALSAPTALGRDPARYLDELKKAYPDDSDIEHFERALTEGFRSNAVRTAEWATETGAGGWLYRFVVPVSNNPFGFSLGATHAAEMEFTFNSFASELPDSAFWYDRHDPEIVKLASDWSNTIIQFARTGNPNGGGLPEWQQYSPDNPQTMVLDRTPRIGNNLNAKDRARWAAYENQ